MTTQRWDRSEQKREFSMLLSNFSPNWLALYTWKQQVIWEADNKENI